MKEKNKLILYVDLLGYTRHLNENEEDAIACLEGADVISSTVDGKFFNDYFLVSDSVFAISDLNNIDNQLNEIADFLSGIFIYNRSSLGIDGDPEKVEYVDIATGNKSIHIEYPLLYRGALGIGDIYTVRDKSNNILRNVTGKSLANIVKLGEKGIGPRLYLTDSVISKLNDKMKNRIIYDEKENKKYYLWSINLIMNISELDYHDTTRICNSFEMFKEMLEIVCKHYDENERMAQIYLDLLDMFIRSYKQFMVENNNDMNDSLKGLLEMTNRYCERSRYEKLSKDLIFKNICIQKAKDIFN